MAAGRIMRQEYIMKTINEILFFPSSMTVLCANARRVVLKSLGSVIKINHYVTMPYGFSSLAIRILSLDMQRETSI